MSNHDWLIQQDYDSQGWSIRINAFRWHNDLVECSLFYSFSCSFFRDRKTGGNYGETYFEVAKNADMPFKVKVADKAE